MAVDVTELLKTLKTQHTEVLALTSAISGGLQRGDRAAVAKALEALKAALIAHIELEDRELYAALIRAAKGDPKVVETAERYSDGMLRLTDGLLGFFRRHRADDIDLSRVKAEWSAFSAALTGRIGSEEATLYPMLARASQRRAS